MGKLGAFGKIGGLSGLNMGNIKAKATDYVSSKITDTVTEKVSEIPSIGKAQEMYERANSSIEKVTTVFDTISKLASTAKNIKKFLDEGGAKKIADIIKDPKKISELTQEDIESIMAIFKSEDETSLSEMLGLTDPNDLISSIDLSDYLPTDLAINAKNDIFKNLNGGIGI